MTEFSRIEWTDHTFNSWWGCSRVSPACRFCYADTQAARYGHDVWRRNGPRRMLSDANWAKPYKWNRDAERAGTPLKVFCASMADVFEAHPDVVEARERLWQVIDDTPWLRWQLLTKRPENVADMAPWGNSWPDHVWLGTSVENQRFAGQRIPILLDIPAKVRFLSCEPLLGPLNLPIEWRHEISWVIAGGESGPKSRETDLEWMRSLVTQCQDAGVATFVKQLGTAWAKDVWYGGRSLFTQGDRKGGDPQHWPTDLRVREFPQSSTAVAS